MIWTVILGILLFSIIIFVHELGHFVTARLFRVKVREFAVGMGPELVSWGSGETKYSLRAIPIGGFCSMEGENETVDDDGSFSAKPWYQKLVVLAAGAFMNIVLGFLIFVVFVSVFYAETGIPSVEVDTVLEQSELYGVLQHGDRIAAVNGKTVNIKNDIDFAMQQCGGAECEITVKRGSERKTFKFKPLAAKYSDGTAAYIVGFNPIIKKANAFGVAKEAFFQTIWMGKIVFVSLGMLIGGKVSVSDMSGPVGVVDAMNTTAKASGIMGLLSMAAFISVNIGIMNLLPIPALDGGRILFVLVEAIRRKPIPPEKEGIVHFIGLVLLMALMVFVTWNDIMRLIGRMNM